MRSFVKSLSIELYVLVIALAIQSCKKDDAAPPILTTTGPTNITQTTVTSGGNIIETQSLQRYLLEHITDSNNRR